MKYFHYNIADDEINRLTGEVPAIPPDFTEYKITMTGLSVYYKTKNGKVTEVIGEGMHEDVCRSRVEEFLSGFSANLV